MNKLLMTLVVILVIGLAGVVAWAIMTQNELNQIQRELVDAQSQIGALTTELIQIKETLVDTEVSLASTEKELDNTDNELMETRITLVRTSNDLDATKLELKYTRNELEDTRNELESITDELSIVKTEADETKEKLTMVQYKLASAEEALDEVMDDMVVMEETLEGLGITLSSSARCYDAVLVDNLQAENPTWEELTVFLESDTTEQHKYIYDEYDCSEFSRDLHNNAEAAGIRAAVVHTWFTGDPVGHALNAFLTTDYGLVYVDCTGAPDRIARVEKGEKLISIEPTYVTQSNIRNDEWWDSILWTVGWYYYTSEMPVLSIEIFW